MESAVSMGAYFWKVVGGRSSFEALRSLIFKFNFFYPKEVRILS